MSAQSQRPTTPEARARAAAAQRRKVDALKAVAAQQLATLRTGKDWAGWLQVVAGVASADPGVSLSLDNTLLILAARGEGWEGTAIASYDGWKARRHQVGRHQSGFALLAGDPQNLDGRDATELVHVWDTRQTVGAPFTPAPIPPIEALTAALEQSTELAQAPRGEDPAWASNIRRLVSDSVAYLIATAHNLPSTQVFPEVASWAGAPGLAEPPDLGVVRDVAQHVLLVHRWVADPTAADVPAIPSRPSEPVRSRSGPTLEATGRSPAPANQATSAGPRPAAAGADAIDVLLAAHERAAHFYASQLDGSWAAAYLDRRVGSIDREIWRPGYAPGGRGRRTALLDHLRQGYPERAITDSGLVIQTQSGLIDRFRDRLVFPILDDQHRPIGFVGRHDPQLDSSPNSPKYLNSANTSIYSKGDRLFGLPQIHDLLRHGALPVLVEGPLDAIAVSHATGGRAAGISALGTALTPSQVAALGRAIPLASVNVVVATDADHAGRAAGANAYTLLAAKGNDPRSPALPAGDDPASYIAREGGAAFLGAATARARPLSHQLIDDLVTEYGDRFRWVEPRVAAAREGARLVGQLTPGVSDGSGTQTRWERDIYYLAEATSVEVGTVHILVLEAGTACSADIDQPGRGPAAGARTGRSAADVAARSLTGDQRRSTGGTPPRMSRAAPRAPDWPDRSQGASPIRGRPR